MSGLKLVGHKNMSTKRKLNVYNKPQKIYIPLVSGGSDNVTLLVKKGDYVFKGSIIARKKGNFKIPIFSSVSGTVLEFEEKIIHLGYKVKCVVIENDFKERIEKGVKTLTKLNELSKEEFLEILENTGIIGLGGAGFPTYVKYQTDKKINTLIVNAVECEPYITADYVLLKEKCEQVLECIDAILEINNIDRALIVLQKHNKDLIDIFNEYIGTYLKIKVVLVDNVYPMGWEKKLIKETLNLTYDRLPIEVGVVVSNVSTVYAIHEALKYHKPLIERIVTFSGDAIKNPQNVLVKIGTPAYEVIDHIGGSVKNKKSILIAGGPMMGSNVDDFIITAECNCVLLLSEFVAPVSKECLRCGKCVSVCPAKICPVLIKDNINNVENLRQMYVDKCIECGLCSYVCPAKINVRNYVKAAKKKVGM